jgi:ATP-dependent helicase YprA (DUF1998 family)
VATIRVKALLLPQIDDPRAPIALYEHQRSLFNAIEQGYPDILLTTPTATGKTAAAAFPIARSGESAIFVYPTKALMADQERSLREKAVQVLQRDQQRQDGLPEKGIVVLEPSTNESEIAQARLLLLRLDSETLGQWQDHLRSTIGSGFRYRGAIIQHLLGHRGRPVWLITNPDVLFLIFALRYHRAAFLVGLLQAFSTLVVDEFHLYEGLTLINVLVLLALAKQAGIRRRILLSATPDPAVLTLIRRFGDFIEIGLGQTGIGREAIKAVTVTTEVQYFPICLIG